MSRTWSWLIAGVLSLTAAYGQYVPGRFIVELEGEPAIQAAMGAKRSERAALMAPRRAQIRAQHSRVRALVEQKPAVVTDTIENVANALIVDAPNATIEELRRIPGVKAVHQVRMYHLALDHAINVIHANDAWNAIGGNQFAGKGIRIGIVDTGIDSTHPAFKGDGFTMPDGFPQVIKDSDRAYTNNKIIVARNYDTSAGSNAKDSKGHGTAVAMTAAGLPNASPYGVITGVAPAAYIGNYKVFPDSSDGAPDSQILKALDDAISDGMDVINLSLGSLLAERVDVDPLVMAVERVTKSGVIVTIAAGNDGPDLNTVGSPGSAPSAITVGNSANDRTLASQVGIENVGELLSIPSTQSGKASAISGSLLDVATLDSDGMACSALPANSLKGRIAFILRGVCFFDDKLNNAVAAGAVGVVVYTDESRPQPLAMGTSNPVPAIMVSYADGVKIKNALGKKSDTVAWLKFNLSPVATNQYLLSGSSSRGPSANLIKPDVVAVGSDLSLAVPVSQGSYSILNGTSFSSPMVAGAIALVKAARPGLRPTQYKSLIVNSASLFSDGTTTASIQQSGAGLLNVAAALKANITSEPAVIGYGVGNGSENTWQTLALTNIGKTADTFLIQVVNTSGSYTPTVTEKSVTLNPGATRWIPVSLQTYALPAGEYQGFVNIKSSATGDTINVPYWYGVSSNVVAHINELLQTDTASAGSRAYLLVRATDVYGIPVLVDPVATATSGNGARVLSIENYDYDVPGSYLITVRMSSTKGANTFHVTFGNISKDITITGN